MRELDGKVCVITGGANGIGKALVRAFDKEGASVAFIDKDGDAGKDLLSSLQDQKKHFFFEGDLASESVLVEFAEEIKKRYGKVDVLINNACFSHKGLLSGCTYEEFNEILRVGVSAPYYLTLLLKEHFKSGASIVNITSTRAFMSQKDTESYSAAKGGITALTHAMAMSLQGLARVNSIAPGWIDTGDEENFSEADRKQHPSERVGVPEDIVRTVLFLCDERSSFINAENITVDGGMSKRMVYHGDEGWKYNK
ncbi:SDR family oxidoreductase [Proteiniclasticum ruminis]|uniref:SDR family oxidoreductase n=1 Tax=Proteiniclasticum ruminis TaxID=398199 RepID=UPI0028AB6C0E|nr:SDR family oxidoreductase [Proteiniclasticum ruminis]